MLLLYLLNNIIVIVILFCLHCLPEPLLTHAKSRFLYYQIRILLLLFYHSRGYVVVDYVVTTHRRGWFLIVYQFTLYLWFKSSTYLLLVWQNLRIVWSWPWLLVLLLLPASHLGWSELTSVSSLDFIYQLVLHCISWLIWPWPRHYLSILINQRRTSVLFFNHNWLPILYYLLSEIKTNVVTARANHSRSNNCCRRSIKSLNHPKTRRRLTCFWSWHLRYL